MKNLTCPASRARRFSAGFTYDITRWLAEHHPRSVEIDWDGYDAALLGPLLRRLHPFADEDLLVEANIPYMDWFRAAKRGRGSDLRWLLSQIDNAELFAQAKIFVRWELGDGSATRTNGRLPGRRKFFYHDAPLHSPRRCVACRPSWNRPPSESKS